MLVAGMDSTKNVLVPVLYHLDPSGTYVQYRAKAIGAGEETAMDHLVDNYNTSMTLSEACGVVVKTLKDVMEEKVTVKNVDLWLLKIGKDEKSGKEIPLIERQKGDALKKLLDASKD